MKVCAAAFVTCLAMNVSPVMGQNLTGAIVAAQGTTSGSIVGCFLDSIQRPLPGATVAVKGDGVERSTVTDGAGCYEFKDLPLTLYRVTARLAGFDNVTRDRLIVAPDHATRVDFTTGRSPICECVGVTGGLAEQWNHAAAVLHLRLADSEPGASSRQGYYRHFATVIRILKRPADLRSDTMFVLQNQRSGTSGPYDVGQELVAFLESDSVAYRIVNDEPGLAAGGGDAAAIAFLVQDGRIQQAPPGFSQYLGMSIDSFLEELRTLSRRQ
jgi:Carboxypeptidase regulatory-like domain